MYPFSQPKLNSINMKKKGKGDAKDLLDHFSRRFLTVQLKLEEKVSTKSCVTSQIWPQG